MTPQQLLTIIPFAASRAEAYAPLLTAAMAEFTIDTPKRQAAFLAQLAHESGSLKYTREIGDDAYFAKYEGRKDLGNIYPGDGLKFKGRGFIQVTGRSNYAACGYGLGIDLINSPEVIEQPTEAARSAGWFWKANNLNQFADWDKFGALTKKINGGYNGLDERIQFWLTARKVLGL